MSSKAFLNARLQQYDKDEVDTLISLVSNGGSDTGAQIAEKLDVHLGHSNWKLENTYGATYGATTTVPVEII